MGMHKLHFCKKSAFQLTPHLIQFTAKNNQLYKNPSTTKFKLIIHRAPERFILVWIPFGLIKSRGQYESKQQWISVYRSWIPVYRAPRVNLSDGFTSCDLRVATRTPPAHSHVQKTSHTHIFHFAKNPHSSLHNSVYSQKYPIILKSVPNKFLFDLS